MSAHLPFVFIMVTLLLDAVGIGLILPVLPQLIAEVSGNPLAGAALWGGALTTAFAVMQFLCGPMPGGLSDRFGRRPVLLISTGVMALGHVVMALAGSIWLLLLGRVLGGITAATHATAAAYIADVSPPERKSANFGLVGAAFGVGFIPGPVIGGLLVEWGTRAPFWAAAGLAAANFAFGLLVLPESLGKAIRRPFRLSQANPFGAFRAIGRLPGLKAPLAIYAMYEFAQIVYPAIWAWFGAARFGWSPGTIGLSLAILGVGFPIMQGILSRGVPADVQGELLGLLQSLRALAMICAPVTFTAIFASLPRRGRCRSCPARRSCCQRRSWSLVAYCWSRFAGQSGGCRPRL